MSRTDLEPLVIFPGQSYLEILETMGLNWGEVIGAGGWKESVRLPGTHLQMLPVDLRGEIANLLSQAFVAGLLTERRSPRKYAIHATADFFQDRSAP